MNIPPHIKPYLDQLEDRMQYILSKEDQRVYGLLAPFIRRGGKRIRPLLCMVCCSAFGADPKSVLDPSVIIELFHNFTLIHDDIEDDSLFRRGEPTLHVSHGLAMALNSGDALYTFLLRELIYLKLPKYDVSILQKMYLDAFKRVVDGWIPFSAILVIFAISAGLIAVNSAFPLPYDERYHFALIEYYSHLRSPIHLAALK
jgi:geranylgeranyl pyrophosphate synthase